MLKFLTSRTYLPLHILGFFIAQAIYASFYAHSFLGGDLVLQSIVRPLIWVGPVLLVLALLGQNSLDYLKLRGHVLNGLIWGALIGSLVILYNLLALYLQHRTIIFKYDSLLEAARSFFDLYGILLMLTEEVLFRGFFLQQIAERLSFPKEMLRFSAANLIQAVLFALLHIMGWTILRAGMPLLTAGIAVLIFALLEGYVLKKTNSLWACVLIHICNNFIATALV